MEQIERNNQAPAVKGRFAPSPTGRMHLGNLFTALLSWVWARSQGGRWLLRIEDLDEGRSRPEYARLIEDDLAWLGLEWDEGGLDDRGPAGPYSQSRRGYIYQEYYQRLEQAGMTYACRCTRADIMAAQAPHESDGRVVYPGTCRPGQMPPFAASGGAGARRVWVPDGEIVFTDRVCGPRRINLARRCGDFVVRRADGGWAYQLAVVVDDALMGVTEVVRGNDLLLSAAQQLHLYRLLGLEAPAFAHVPLVVNGATGVRLSKRDTSLAMDELRRRHTPEELVGRLAFMAGLIDEPQPVTPAWLAAHFVPDSLAKGPVVSA